MTNKINELSQDLLKKYHSKAYKNFKDAMVAQHHLRDKFDPQFKDYLNNTAIKRFNGMNKAEKKLHKSSYKLVEAILEQNVSLIDEIFNKILSEKITESIEEKKMEIADSMFDTNQLDELSKETLANYIGKSHIDATKETNDRASKTVLKKDYFGSPEYNKSLDKLSKRTRGIFKATRKLAK